MRTLNVLESDEVVTRNALMLRNIQIAKLQQCFYAALAMQMPILNSVWLDNGLSFESITILKTIFALSVVFTEVPIGILADTIGYRMCVILSHVSFLIMSILYLNVHSFFGFVFAELFYGFGVSLSLSSLQTLLYSSLKEINQEDSFGKIFSNVTQYNFLCMGLASYFSGIIAEKVGDYAVLLLITILFLLSLLVVTFFTEPDVKRVKITGKRLIRIGKVVLSNNFLLWLLLIGGSIAGIRKSSEWLMQPYFLDYDQLSIKWVGLVFALGYAFAALGCKILRKKTENSKILLWLSVITQMLCCILMGSFAGHYGFISFFVLQAAQGFFKVLIINNLCSRGIEETRATILSIFHGVYHSWIAFVGCFSGFIADRYGIPVFLTLSGFAIIFIFVVFQPRFTH